MSTGLRELTATQLCATGANGAIFSVSLEKSASVSNQNVRGRTFGVVLAVCGATLATFYHVVYVLGTLLNVGSCGLTCLGFTSHDTTICSAYGLSNLQLKLFRCNVLNFLTACSDLEQMRWSSERLPSPVVRLARWMPSSSLSSNLYSPTSCGLYITISNSLTRSPLKRRLLQCSNGVNPSLPIANLFSSQAAFRSNRATSAPGKCRTCTRLGV